MDDSLIKRLGVSHPIRLNTSSRLKDIDLKRIQCWIRNLKKPILANAFLGFEFDDKPVHRSGKSERWGWLQRLCKFALSISSERSALGELTVFIL